MKQETALVLSIGAIALALICAGAGYVTSRLCRLVITGPESAYNTCGGPGGGLAEGLSRTLSTGAYVVSATSILAFFFLMKKARQ